MNKVYAIARAEFVQAVFSKAFLIGIFVMPILMGGSILFQKVMGDRVDLTPRRCAVVDPTGVLWPTLEQAVAMRNEVGIWELPDEEAAADADGATSGDGAASADERKQRRPRFELELVAASDGERIDARLSERVDAGELNGFVLLDAGLLDGTQEGHGIAYHTDEPTFSELPNWIEEVVNAEVRQRRFAAEGMDAAIAMELAKKVRLRTFGLIETNADGSIKEAEEENDIRTFVIPVASLMLLFMLVMSTAPQLMNQVLEEKMQRISEVLVSSVTPFQLMLGKLFGSVLVSATLALVYLGGVLWATYHFDVSHFIPGQIYVWFLLMLVFALLMYGSLFGALGSACSEIRDAQSLLAPAMILLMIPLFSFTAILESPNGSVATALTYFPTATPMVFLLRVLTQPGPPTWELVAAPLMCLVTTVVLVWASSKIFRVGVLSQGQAPTFRKLAGWVFSK